MSRKRATAALFEQMVEDPRRALRDAAFWNESVCRRWLDRVDDLVHEDLRRARDAAVTGVRLALRTARVRSERRITHRCLVALSLAVLGSTYRAGGQLDRAERWLAKADSLRGRCRDRNVHVEIDLRTAYLRLHQACRDDGTFDLEILGPAIALTDAAVGKAHGPVTVVRALNARATLLAYAGDFIQASRDARAALDLGNSEDRKFDHWASLTIVVHCLTKLGGQSHREQAQGHLERLVRELPHRRPDDRARLMWAQALLMIPDRNRKAAARRLLDQARGRFLGLGRQAEAAAVTAEIVRLKPEGAVPQLAAELLEILDPGPVSELVESLRTARMVERVDIAESLRSIVAGPNVLPAAVVPPP